MSGRQGERLAAEGGEEEDVLLQQAHHVGPAGQDRERHAVGDRLREAGEISGDAEPLLRAAERQPEAGPHLVEDQQGSARRAEVLQPLEKIGAGRLERRRLQDHAGDVVVERRVERREIVVGEGVGQRSDLGRDPQPAIGHRDVPVVPAVVAAAEDLRAPGVGAGEPDGRGGHVGAILGEADVLRAGHHFVDLLGDLHLQHVRKREGDSVGQLRADGCVDHRIGVAEDQRADPHRQVEVLVPVDVDHVGAPAGAEKLGRHTAHVLPRAFGQRLRGAGDQAAGPRVERVRGHDGGIVQVEGHMVGGHGVLLPFDTEARGSKWTSTTSEDRSAVRLRCARRRRSQSLATLNPS